MNSYSGDFSSAISHTQTGLPKPEEYFRFSELKNAIPRDLAQLMADNGVEPDDKIYFPPFFNWVEGYPPYGILWNTPDQMPTEVFTAEHFSHIIPPVLENMGMSDGFDFKKHHFAWDPGAGALGIGVAKELGKHGTPPPVMFTTLSRLVIDPNRDEDHSHLITPHQDGHEIIGNGGLAMDRRITRLERIHRTSGRPEQV